MNFKFTSGFNIFWVTSNDYDQVGNVFYQVKAFIRHKIKFKCCIGVNIVESGSKVWLAVSAFTLGLYQVAMCG